MLRWIDVINDIAFLIMDLQYRNRSDLAYRFLNSYLEDNGYYRGLGVLRFYLADRALVRAKIAAIRASQTTCPTATDECVKHLSLASAYFEKGHPALIITHGLPGSGKTTISQIVLERFKMIRLRSDVERKRLCGIAVHEHSIGDIYDEKTTLQTYAHLLQLARELMKLGYRVIVDAAFLKNAERQQFKMLAQEMNAPFIILSVKAKLTLLEQRIQLRQDHGKDASEADLTVPGAIKKQLCSASSGRAI